jgi:hypothetical protein
MLICARQYKRIVNVKVTTGKPVMNALIPIVDALSREVRNIDKAVTDGMRRKTDNKAWKRRRIVEEKIRVSHS